MAMELNLPVGFYHANLLFTGTAAPQGAAMTFGGSAASGSAATIAGAINTAWNTHLKSVFNSGLTFQGTRVKLGPMEDGPFAFVASGTPGTNAGAVAPPNVAILIRKNTALGGRQGSGRLYQPGLLEGGVGDDGTIAAGTRTSLQTAWTAFYGALQSVTYPMYLLHSFGLRDRVVNHTVITQNVPARAPTEVTSLSVDSIIGTQRRRIR